MTLVEVLQRREAEEPDHAAYTFLERDREVSSLTYSELALRARSLGAWLERAGMARERALLLFPPGLDFVSAFFGCLAGGTVAVPVSLPQQKRHLPRLRSVAADARPRLALTSAEQLDRLREATLEIPELAGLEWLAVDELPDELAADWRPPGIGGSDLAFLQYTSGSTASPRGVMVSHANLVHNCGYLASLSEDDEESVGASWLPHFHDMGLIEGILHPFYSGYPTYLMSPLAFLQRPGRWLSTISKYRVTTSGAPNFAYDLCARKVSAEERETLDLRSWKVAYASAEPVRAATLRQFAAAFAPCGFGWKSFYPVYGLAEGTLVVSGGQRQDEPAILGFDVAALEQKQVATAPEGRAGTQSLVGCGRVSCGVRVVIADPETRTLCPPGTIGEIWISGPSVAQGYWQRAEDSAHVFGAFLADTGEGPFLRTGDLGFFEQGELFIAGRLKDLIILAGRNIHPQDIEVVVEKSHPAVRASCCAAFTVDLDGEERLVIAAEVGRSRGADGEAGNGGGGLQEVVRAVRRGVAEELELQVHEVVLLAPKSIPKTSSGKLQRHACRAGFLARTLSPLEDTWTS